MDKKEYNEKFSKLSQQIRELDSKRADLTSKYIKDNAEYQPGEKILAKKKHLPFNGLNTDAIYECTKVQVSVAGNFKYYFKPANSTGDGWSSLLSELEVIKKV